MAGCIVDGCHVTVEIDVPKTNVQYRKIRQVESELVMGNIKVLSIWLYGEDSGSQEREP
jgi:hypothetical protein